MAVESTTSNFLNTNLFAKVILITITTLTAQTWQYLPQTLAEPIVPQRHSVKATLMVTMTWMEVTWLSLQRILEELTARSGGEKVKGESHTEWILKLFDLCG